jgi:hypothetical protein
MTLSDSFDSTNHISGTSVLKQSGSVSQSENGFDQVYSMEHLASSRFSFSGRFSGSIDFVFSSQLSTTGLFRATSFWSASATISGALISPVNQMESDVSTHPHVIFDSSRLSTPLNEGVNGGDTYATSHGIDVTHSISSVEMMNSHISSETNVFSSSLKRRGTENTFGNDANTFRNDANYSSGPWNSGLTNAAQSEKDDSLNLSLVIAAILMMVLFAACFSYLMFRENKHFSMIEEAKEKAEEAAKEQKIAKRSSKV